MSFFAPAGAVGLGIGAVSFIIFAGIKYYKNKSNKIPEKWSKVGYISDIFCYPIKSCAPLKVKKADCHVLGLHIGCIRDRTFMIINEKGNFITGRQEPILTQVFPSISTENPSQLIFTSPLMPEPLILDIKSFSEEPNCKARIWDQEVDVINCGQNASLWFSTLLNIDGLSLVHYPLDYATRPVRPKNRIFKDLNTRDCGAFPDVTSFMMVSEESVDKLNEKLETKVTPLHFRPNFVIRGCDPFVEDNWQWLRFGKNGPIFKVVKPCTRCIFTTINPENGIKDPNNEPLKTLKTFRQLKDRKLRKASEDRPVMGIHLALIDNATTVNFQDVVYVGEN